MKVSKYKDYIFSTLKDLYTEKEKAMFMSTDVNSSEAIGLKKKLCAVAYECIKSGIPFQIEDELVWIQYNFKAIPVSLMDLQESQQKYENILLNSEEEVEKIATDLDIKESINTLRFIMQSQDNVIKSMINNGNGIGTGSSDNVDVQKLESEINRLKLENERIEIENKDLNQQIMYLDKEHEDKLQQLKKTYEEEKENIEKECGLQLTNMLQEHDDEIQQLRVELEKQKKKVEQSAPDTAYFEQIRDELKKSESEKMLLEKTNEETLSQLQELKQKYQEAKMYAFEDKKFNCANANAFNRFFGEDNKNMTMAYVMLNSLQEINMKAGRSAGDKGIMMLKNALMEIFGYEYLYRIMGGQFFVFSKNDEDLKMLATVKEDMKKHNLDISYGVVRVGEFEDKNTAINQCMERCIRSAEQKKKNLEIGTNFRDKEKMAVNRGNESYTRMKNKYKNSVQKKQEVVMEDDDCPVKEITESYFMQQKELDENLRQYVESDSEEDDFSYEEIQGY